MVQTGSEWRKTLPVELDEENDVEVFVSCSAPVSKPAQTLEEDVGSFLRQLVPGKRRRAKSQKRGGESFLLDKAKHSPYRSNTDIAFGTRGQRTRAE